MTRLHLALLTSLALHAMGLLVAGSTQPLLSGQRHNSLSVELVGNTEDVTKMRITQVETTQRPASSSFGRRAAQTTPATADRHDTYAVADVHNADPSTPATRTSTTPASGVASTAGDPPADTVNRIKAQLYTDLARHFDYPEMARRRGWEGRVMVAVNVASDGQLQQIRVARSSGFTLLDDSALQSLRQVDRIAAAVALLNGRKLAMQIPVIYRLQGEP